MIPGNDDSSRAIRLYARGVADAVLEGKSTVIQEIVQAATSSSKCGEAPTTKRSRHGGRGPLDTAVRDMRATQRVEVARWRTFPRAW